MVYPITGADVTWPFPMLFRGEKTTVLLGSTTGHTITESDWSKAAFAANPYTTGSSWQFASFQETWFATNGVTLLYATARAAHVPAKYTALTVRSLAAHDDRLFVAGLAGAHLSSAAWTALFTAWALTRPDDQVVHEDMALTENWVVWCQRGGGESGWPFAAFLIMLGLDSGEAYDPADDMTGYFIDAIERGEIGMTPCKWPGKILAMKTMGSSLFLYGENGVSALSPDGDVFGYRERKVAGFGLLSRGAIAGARQENLDGTVWEHVFLDRKRRLYRWSLGEMPQMLEFDHLLVASAGTPEVLVSYDDSRREYWVSNGTWSYLLKDGRLFGPMSYKPTSLLNAADGQLVGPALGLTGPFTCILRTCPVDLNERGLKHVPQMSASMRGLTDTVCWVEYCNSNRNAYRPGRVVPMNYQGVGFPKTSFSDGKMVLQGTSTGSAELHRVEIKWQAEDKRYRRGTTGTPEVA
jgi:hypothetical protein